MYISCIFGINRYTIVCLISPLGSPLFIEESVKNLFARAPRNTEHSRERFFTIGLATNGQ